MAGPIYSGWGGGGVDTLRPFLLAIMAASKFWWPDYEKFARKLAPKLEYRIMGGTGHFLMLENPEEFNRLLLAFLAKQKY